MEYRYSFNDIIVLIGGVQITGFAEGDDAVTIEYQSDLFNTVVGADGQGVASRIKDNRANMTLRLLQTSPSNDFLSGILTAYMAEVYTPLPIIIRDAAGNSLHGAPTSYITARPTISYGQNQTSRDWVLGALQMQSFIGSSSPVA